MDAPVHSHKASATNTDVMLQSNTRTRHLSLAGSAAQMFA